MTKPKTDEQLLKRLRKEAPEVLEAKVDFNAAITKVLRADPSHVDRRMERIHALTKSKVRKNQRKRKADKH